MRSFGYVFLVVLSMLGAGRAWAQNQSDPTVDCSLDGKQLSCSRQELLRRFAEAKTVMLQTDPRDRVATAQLADFAKSLGKQVVPELPADITIHLVHTPAPGVSVGPSDQELATLRVFTTRKGADRSHLIWVETFRGQIDTPWPMVVRGVTQQFQSTLAGH